MNLTDPEFLELNELCGAVVDGTLTEAQRDRLARWLAESEDVRRHYACALGQSASLHSYAAEMQAEAPEAPVSLTKSFRYALWWTTVVPAAAALVIGFVFRESGAGDVPESAAQASEFVGRVTGVKSVQWISAPLVPGAHVRKGQQLELAAGAAEITFDSGARVVLSGAAELAINSAWEASLRRGTLRATVPPEAVGFRVSNPTVEVVDLGGLQLTGAATRIRGRAWGCERAAHAKERNAARQTASVCTEVGARWPRVSYVMLPLVHVDAGFLARESGEAAAETTDGGQGEGDLAAA